MKAMSTLINFMLFIVLIISCQNDINIDTSNNETNNKDSVFTSKVKRTSMFNGALDDVLDNSPCFAIQFPVNILLNTIPLTINTVADLNLISNLDVIVISFPITVTNYDYSETTINNQLELDAISSACEELVNNEMGPIDCIDFNYPLTIFTATTNQEQNTFVINSDQELYVFIDNLGANIFYSFKYPLQITLPNVGVLFVENDIALDTYLGICF